MLEVLVSTRFVGEKGIKRRGDIIVAKLAGASWGEAEKKEFLIVQLEDVDLEAKLVAMGENAVIAYPYAETQLDENGKPFMVHRSTKFIDIDSMPNKVDILDTTKELAVVSKADAATHLDTRVDMVKEVTDKIALVEAAIAVKKAAEAELDKETPLEELP